MRVENEKGSYPRAMDFNGQPAIYIEEDVVLVNKGTHEVLVIGVLEQRNIEQEGYEVRSGYFGTGYRGKHRSHTKRAGQKASFRNGGIK